MTRVEGVGQRALNPPLLAGQGTRRKGIKRDHHSNLSSVQFACSFTLSLTYSLSSYTMKAPLFLALLLIVVLVTDEAHGHTPLSMMRTMGRWATRPLRSMTSGMTSGMRSLRPLKHLIVKGLMAKKLALIKAGVIAKPLVLKAMLLKAIHRGLVPGAAARTPAPAARAESMVTVPTPQRYIILQPSVRQVPQQVMMAQRTATPINKI